MFLSQLEIELFEDSNFSHFHWQTFSRGEGKALGDLVEDRGIVIGSADRGSCVVIWDGKDYLKDVDRQFSDNKVYRDVKYTKNMLSLLVDKSNKIFQSLSKRNIYQKKNLNTLHTITRMLLT